MSTTENSGLEPEQQTPPTNADGLAFEIDRSVLGTDLRSGFAELRARATETMEEATATISTLRRGGHMVAMHTAAGMVAACDTFIEWIDELSGCEECMEEEVGD